MLLSLPLDYTIAQRWERKPLATCRADGTRQGKGTEVAVSLGQARLADLREALSDATGLWLTGAVECDDIEAAGQLDSLAHLDVMRAPLGVELLERIAKSSLSSLRLRVVDGANVSLLRGLQATELGIGLKRESGPVDWAALGSVQRLAVWGQGIALDAEAAEALVAGDLEVLRTDGVQLSPEALEVLTRNLHTVVARSFSGVAPELTVKDAPRLRALELSVTHIASLEVRDCAALKWLRTQHCQRTLLAGLPALRVATVGGHTTVQDLPALERVVCTADVSALDLSGVPRLRRVELEHFATPESEATARATGAEVRVEGTPPKKAKATAPKRKLSPKQRTWPKVGWDGEPYGLLVLGRRAGQPMAEKTAKALGLVGDFWSKESGAHVVAACPIDGLNARLEDGLPDVVAGVVVGFVSTDRPDAVIDGAAIEDARALLETDLSELFHELDGVAKRAYFAEAETRMWLVAAGPDASVRLRRGDEAVLVCDTDIVSTDAVRPEALGADLQLRLLHQT